MSKRIVKVKQTLDADWKHTDVYCTYGDGTFDKLFIYYSDEINITNEELIGLTRKEALDLRHAKDVAYIQS